MRRIVPRLTTILLIAPLLAGSVISGAQAGPDYQDANQRSLNSSRGASTSTSSGLDYQDANQRALTSSQSASTSTSSGSDALLNELMAANAANGYGRAGDDGSGPVDFLYGILWPLSQGNHVDAAESFLAKYGPILSFPAGFDLEKEIEAKRWAILDNNVSLPDARHVTPCTQGNASAPDTILRIVPCFLGLIPWMGATVTFHFSNDSLVGVTGWDWPSIFTPASPSQSPPSASPSASPVASSPPVSPSAPASAPPTGNGTPPLDGPPNVDPTRTDDLAAAVQQALEAIAPVMAQAMAQTSGSPNSSPPQTSNPSPTPLTLSGDSTIEEYWVIRQDPTTGTFRLVYRVEVNLVVGPNKQQWRVVIDHDRGVVPPMLASMLDAPVATDAKADAKAYTRYPSDNIETVDLCQIKAPYLSRLGWTLSGDQIKSRPTDLKVTKVPDGHFKFDREHKFLWIIPTGINTDFLQANAFYQLCKAQDRALTWGVPEVGCHELAYDVWGRGEGKDKDSQMPAYFNPADQTIHFLRLPGDRYPAEDPTVIWHEYGHYVQTLISPYWAKDDPGSLEDFEAQAVAEGFADYFAAAMSENDKLWALWRPARKFLFWTLEEPPSVLNNKGYTEDIRYYYRFSNDSKFESLRPLSFLLGGPRPAVAGLVFAGLCWDIREKLTAEVATPLIIEGIRRAPAPLTFHNAERGILLAAIERNRAGDLATLNKIFAYREHRQ